MNFMNPNCHVHFIGIGGISMSALANILKAKGVQVTGSDISDSHMIEKIRANGIPVDIPHQINHIRQAELVVYTAAIAKDNCELVYAREHGIPCWERPVMLGKIMAHYPISLGISGTHGKTTVTSMISHIALKAGLDPTLLVGGELPDIDGNLRIGHSDYFVTEACEYVDSFLNFHPAISFILNIEEDHLDYFSGIEQIKQSFRQYAGQTSRLVIACGEDENVTAALKDISVPVTTFGAGCDYEARDVQMGEQTVYTLYRKGKPICPVLLTVPGMHNVKNSLAALAGADALGIPLEKAASFLQDFTGAKRRFEYKGSKNGVTVYDDYAHHPTEITATLNTAKEKKTGTMWCVFQPHTYTRTKALFSQFALALSKADRAIITDIYAAREKDTGLVHASQLAEAVPGALYLPDFPSIVSYLQENAKPGDMVLTVGAGTVYQAGELFLK